MDYTCILNITWGFPYSSPPHLEQLLGALMFNASSSQIGKVSVNGVCHDLKTPLKWLLIWDDCFAAGKQVSFILGPTNDSRKDLTWAEFQLPDVWARSGNWEKPCFLYSIRRGQGSTTKLSGDSPQHQILFHSSGMHSQSPLDCSNVIWVHTEKDWNSWLLLNYMAMDIFVRKLLAEAMAQR